MHLSFTTIQSLELCKIGDPNRLNCHSKGVPFAEYDKMVNEVCNQIKIWTDALGDLFSLV